MTDDIVDRIREEAKSQTTLGQALALLRVADEIEGLTEERDDWKIAYNQAFNELGYAVDELERLRAAGDALVNALEAGEVQETKIRMDDWKKARRG